MSTSQSNARAPASGPSTEPKARGANRSTKVAGKLKVLPEQPEPVVPKDRLEQQPPAPPKREEGEGSGTAGDSDDDGADDEEDDAEDVEVRSPNYHRQRTTECNVLTDVQPNRPNSGGYG